jgi:hypothetical protein
MHDLEGVQKPRRVGSWLVTTGLLGAALAMFAFIGTAGADSPSDPRATFHDGNATTCADVGFGGDQILGSGGSGQPSGTVTQTPDGSIVVTISDHLGGGQQIDVAVDPSSGVVIDAIIVKGGNGYNQYPGNVLDDLIPPLTNGGTVPMISHWFLCYEPGSPPPPTTGGGGGGGGTSTSTITPGAPSAATPVAGQPRFTG